MKKPIVAALAAVALSAGAHAETKFYGKFNVSTAYNDLTEEFTVDSHASRLGIKGSDDLGFATLLYKAEYQHNVDAGGLSPRGTYIGLAYDGLGEVKLGRMDTPLKKSQGKFDLFNDVYDIKRAIDGENRESNSINYTSEEIGNLVVSASAVLEQAASDGYSVSAVFEKGDIYASAAYDTKVDSNESIVRVTGIYTHNSLRFGALVNMVDSDDVAANAEDVAYAFNVALTKGLHTFKAQAAFGDQGEVRDDFNATGGQTITLGVDRKLAKTTTAFAMFDTSEVDGSDSVNELRVGLVHKF